MNKTRGIPIQPRKSVRILSQEGYAVSVLARATARVQSKYNLRSTSKGISLLNRFPYNRMTHNEVAALFQAYNIKLGCGDLDAPTIVTALKELDRSAFDQLIKQAFDNIKQQGSEHALRIVRNDLGQLVVQ